MQTPTVKSSKRTLDEMQDTSQGGDEGEGNKENVPTPSQNIATGNQTRKLIFCFQNYGTEGENLYYYADQFEKNLLAGQASYEQAEAKHVEYSTQTTKKARRIETKRNFFTIIPIELTMYGKPQNKSGGYYQYFGVALTTTSYNVFNHYPALDIDLLKSKVISPFDLVDNGFIYGRFCAAAFSKRCFGYSPNLQQLIEYNELNPKHIKGLAMIIKYTRMNGTTLSEQRFILPEDLQEVSHAIVNLNLTNDVDFAEKKFKLLESFFSTQITKMIQSIYNKSRGYDKNIKLKDSASNVVLINITATNPNIYSVS